ncbi:MAG: hypothetical protein ACI4EG_15570 [Fusicatenibacter sp.]
MPQTFTLPSLPVQPAHLLSAGIAAFRINPAALLPAACLRKPATGSFPAVMGTAPATPIFFFTKRNKNRKRKDGENEWRSIIWKRKL